MNNIFLTSNGFNNFGHRSQEIEQLFTDLANGKTVLLIGNAAKISNFASRETVKQNFLNVGATKVDLLDLDESNLDRVFDYDILYCLGGDIGELITLVNSTDFKEKLIKYLETGIYIGESAGSMILDSDLEWCYEIKRGTKPKYDIILPTYKGLGFIDEHIMPHYDTLTPELIAKMQKYQIRTINDGEFIPLDFNNNLANKI